MKPSVAWAPAERTMRFVLCPEELRARDTHHISILRNVRRRGSSRLTKFPFHSIVVLTHQERRPVASLTLYLHHTDIFLLRPIQP